MAPGLTPGLPILADAAISLTQSENNHGMVFPLPNKLSMISPPTPVTHTV